MSSTSSPGRTAASATICVAHSSVSGCQPHARRDRTEADMADHVQEEGHRPKVGGPVHRPPRISAPAGPVGPGPVSVNQMSLGPMSKAGAARSVPGIGGPSSLIERTHVMSVELNAYLFFPGNAEQAIVFYQQVFGGQVTVTRVGDVDPTAAPEQKNLVINAQL